jgi:hypothetical protein
LEHTTANRVREQASPAICAMLLELEHRPSPLGQERLLSAMRVGVQFVRQSPRLRAEPWPPVHGS